MANARSAKEWLEAVVEDWRLEEATKYFLAALRGFLKTHLPLGHSYDLPR